MKKRISSILLAFIMVVTMIPMMTFATESENVLPLIWRSLQIRQTSIC